MDDLIPILAIICCIGLPVGSFMLFRVLAHRERMEMIRQGVAPPPRFSNWKAQQAAPPVGPPPYVASQSSSRKGRCKDNDEIEAPHVTLRKGVKLSMIGLGITIGLSLIGYHGDSFHPGPWLLGGLIPLFIGLAQVILALLSGATLTPIGQQQWTGQQAPPQFGPGPGPTANPGAAQSQTPYNGSYTYRPGDLQELQPPLSPPDRR